MFFYTVYFESTWEICLETQIVKQEMCLSLGRELLGTADNAPQLHFVRVISPLWRPLITPPVSGTLTAKKTLEKRQGCLLNWQL